MASLPRRDTQDVHGVRSSTYAAIRRAADDEKAVAFVSATVLNLIGRLDAAKVEPVWDRTETREAAAFLIRGRLVTNSGQLNRYALAEALTAENVDEVMARRAAAARIDVPATCRPGSGLCTVCAQPVDLAAYVGWPSTTHPLCDPGDDDG